MRTRIVSFGVGLILVLGLSGCWTHHYARFEGVLSSATDDAVVAEQWTTHFPEVVTLPDGTVSIVADLGWTARCPAYLVLLLEDDDISRRAGTLDTDEALAAWFIDGASFRPSDWPGRRLDALRRHIEATEAYRLGELPEAVPLSGTVSIERPLGDNDLAMTWGWWTGHRITVDLHSPVSPRIGSLIGRFSTRDAPMTAGHSLAMAPIGLGMMLHYAIEANARHDPPDPETTPHDRDRQCERVRSPP